MSLSNQITPYNQQAIQTCVRDEIIIMGSMASWLLYGYRYLQEAFTVVVVAASEEGNFDRSTSTHWWLSSAQVEWKK